MRALLDLFAQLGDLRLADPRQPHRLHQMVDAPGRHAVDPGLLDSATSAFFEFLQASRKAGNRRRRLAGVAAPPLLTTPCSLSSPARAPLRVRARFYDLPTDASRSVRNCGPYRGAGPTGLIVTTTATGLEPELETRLLSLTVTDTPEQTKAVFQALARNDHSLGTVQVDYERWHGLQNWLTAGERNVVIPFAEQLADRVLALAGRQRRDFGALLTLIRAHALLHRGSRDRNEAGAINATIADYAVVRELVAELFAEGIEATVSTTVRETVDAVAALKQDEVSLGELAAKLGLDKSVTSRRLRQATEFGYLVNRETRGGRPARIVLGDPMPEMVKLLPEPGELGA